VEEVLGLEEPGLEEPGLEEPGLDGVLDGMFNVN